jgi:hypothetical protein
MSTGHDKSSEPSAAGKDLPRPSRRTFSSSEIAAFTVFNGVIGTISGAVSLIGLYVHGSTAVLSWSLGLLALVLLAYLGVHRGIQHKGRLPLVIAAGVLTGSTLIGVTAGVVIYHLRTAAKRQMTYTYTVDPTKWAPAPVPGLTLTQGETVTIAAISGQWTCATDAGPAGIQGNPDYTATDRSWAVPSAVFCSLIGKVGDGQWQELGTQPQFVADRSGPLALTVNELMPGDCTQPPSNTSCFTDNMGAIKIQITVR